jgi:hypothetical protein
MTALAHLEAARAHVSRTAAGENVSASPAQRERFEVVNL